MIKNILLILKFDMDVRNIILPRMYNYNKHTINYLSLVESIFPDASVSFSSVLDMSNISNCIMKKGTYYCQVHICTDGGEIMKLDFPWLVMIGSNIDFIIRHLGLRYVYKSTLLSMEMKNLKYIYETKGKQDMLSRVITCFIINGCLKQLPLYITNNKLNYHVVKGKPIVRKYVYKGSEGTQIDFDYSNDSLSLTCCRGKITLLNKFSYHAKHCNIVPCFDCENTFGSLKSLFPTSIQPLCAIYFALKYYEIKKRSIDHLGKQ
jgi:hypothetical protein